jgi:hypothetical protein
VAIAAALQSAVVQVRAANGTVDRETHESGENVEER